MIRLIITGNKFTRLLGDRCHVKCLCNLLKTPKVVFQQATMGYLITNLEDDT